MKSEKTSTSVQISIIIPAYNEESRIEETLIRTISYCKEHHPEYEIIVVDDGSRDKTTDIVRNYSKDRVRLLINKTNRGKGYSVKRGMASAKGALILFSDSDLATPIEELDSLVKHIDDGYDIAIASRRLRGSILEVKQPLIRRVLGTLFPLLVRLVVLKGIKDTQCGFKLFRRKTAKKIIEFQSFNRFSFDVELLFISSKMGSRLIEVPVRWIDKQGSTVSTMRDSIFMFLDLFLIRFNNLKGEYNTK